MNRNILTLEITKNMRQICFIHKIRKVSPLSALMSTRSAPTWESNAK